MSNPIEFPSLDITWYFQGKKSPKKNNSERYTMNVKKLNFPFRFDNLDKCKLCKSFILLSYS